MKLNGIRKYINGFFWGLVSQKNKCKKNLLKIHFLIFPTFRSGLIYKFNLIDNKSEKYSFEEINEKKSEILQ